MSDKKIRKKAFAKINLGLDVLGKRADGYHEVKMIMQSVNLYDELEFMLEDPSTAKERITLLSNDKTMPLGEENLVYKAARLLMDEFQVMAPVRIHIQKNIPMAAGMAGGSSDCAATLKGINELFDLKLSLEELLVRGKLLGADVPYCLMGGTCLSEGIGEILTRLPDAPQSVVVLAKPEEGVSTKEVYQALDAGENEEHPDIDGMVLAIKNQNKEEMIARLGNVLEKVTIPRCKKVAAIKDCLKQSGADGVLMSGSGPTVFGLFEEKKAAEEAVSALNEQGFAKDIIVTEFCR